MNDWSTAKLERAYPDEDCGCLVEEWVYNNVHLTLHFEPDGSLELFADGGDWERDVALKATSMEGARSEAFAWVDTLPTEEDAAKPRPAEPKPCPCCGSRAEPTFNPSRTKVGISCSKCSLAQIPGYDSAAAALVDWNLRVDDGWQMIETAPKDGTTIDVWRDGTRETVRWGFPEHCCGEMGQYCDSDWHSIKQPGWVCATFGEFVGGKHDPFTHWKPLPHAPRSTARADDGEREA